MYRVPPEPQVARAPRDRWVPPEPLAWQAHRGCAEPQDQQDHSVPVDHLALPEIQAEPQVHRVRKVLWDLPDPAAHLVSQAAPEPRARKVTPEVPPEPREPPEPRVRKAFRAHLPDKAPRVQVAPLVPAVRRVHQGVPPVQVVHPDPAVPLVLPALYLVQVVP